MLIRPRGFTLLEVLITMIVLAVGLLGLAHLQTKMQGAQVESYQRAQAVLLLQDMVNRLDANRGQTLAGNYVANNVGTGDAFHQDDEDAAFVEQHAGCSLDATGTAITTIAGRDLCEWSHALTGASESVGGANVGAMIDGRGCVTVEQAPTFAPCRPGIYRVQVAWQGLNPTAPPDLNCGQNLYGDERLRRVVSARTVISLPQCQ